MVIWPTDPFQEEKHSAPPKCTLRAKSGLNLYPKTSTPKTLSTAQGDYQQLILTTSYVPSLEKLKISV